MDNLQNQINILNEQNKIEIEYRKILKEKIKFIYLLIGIILTMQGIEISLLLEILNRI